MTNRTPEQDLIDAFVSDVENHDDDDFKIDTLHNKGCKSRTYADIEYTSKSGTRWAIEAKSNDSKDAHNTVHKFFGELLKETGRANRNNCKIGILIPEDSKLFYSRLFRLIKRTKFISYGKLIPVDRVFTFGNSGVETMSWAELYDCN